MRLLPALISLAVAVPTAARAQRDPAPDPLPMLTARELEARGATPAFPRNPARTVAVTSVASTVRQAPGLGRAFVCTRRGLDTLRVYTELTQYRYVVTCLAPTRGSATLEFTAPRPTTFVSPVSLQLLQLRRDFEAYRTGADAVAFHVDVSDHALAWYVDQGKPHGAASSFAAFEPGPLAKAVALGGGGEPIVMLKAPEVKLGFTIPGPEFIVKTVHPTLFVDQSYQLPIYVRVANPASGAYATTGVFAVQYASTNTASSCDGWDAPAGLLESYLEAAAPISAAEFDLGCVNAAGQKCGATTATPVAGTASPPIDYNALVDSLGSNSGAGLGGLKIDPNLVDPQVSAVVDGKIIHAFPAVIGDAANAWPRTIYVRVVALGDGYQCQLPPSAWLAIEVPGAKNPGPFIKKALIAAAANLRTAMEAKLKSAFATQLGYVPPTMLSHPERYITRGNGQIHPNVDEWRAVDLNGGDLYDWENPGTLINWPQGCTFDAAATVAQIESGHSTGWWDDFWGFVFESWDSIAGTYNKIVGMATEVITYAVPTCHDSVACREFVGALVHEALASLGAPPTLPSTGQLIHDGKDYLASLAVSTAFGALPNAGGAQWAVDLIQETTSGALRQQVRDGLDELERIAGCVDPFSGYNQSGVLTNYCNYSMSNPYTWGQPDPAHQAHPAMLYLRVANNAAGEAVQAGSPIQGVELTGGFCRQGGAVVTCTKRMFPTRRQIKVHDYLNIYQDVMIEVPVVMPPEGVLIPVALEPKLPTVTYLNGTYGQNTPSFRFLLDGKAYDLTVAAGQLADDNVGHQLLAPWLIKSYGGDIALTDMGGTISAEIIDAPPGSPANTGKTTFFITSMVETWTHVGARDDVDAEFESQQLVITSAAYAGAAGRIRDGIVDGVPGHGDNDPSNGYVGAPVIGPACPGW